MKIRLLTSRAGVDFTQARGDVIEVLDDEAIRMIDDGQAEAFNAAEEKRLQAERARAEKAAAEAAERAEADAKRAAENAAFIEAVIAKARVDAELAIAANGGEAPAKSAEPVAEPVVEPDQPEGSGAASGGDENKDLVL